MTTTDNNEEQFSRGMVVIAHADDAEFGCSGTVAKLCADGWEMVYVMCTDGSKGSSDREITQAELAAIRRQEQINAGKVLGLKDVVFLDYEDSLLQPTLELRKDITREIRRHKPDVVITMYPMRNLDGGFGVGHPDHIAAGEAALQAVFPTARDHMTFPDLLDAGFEPHKVAEVWIMGHPEPDLYVDVTQHMDTSINALMEHVSQMDGRGRGLGARAHGRMEARARQGHGHAIRRSVQAHRIPPVGWQLTWIYRMYRNGIATHFRLRKEHAKPTNFVPCRRSGYQRHIRRGVAHTGVARCRSRARAGSGGTRHHPGIRRRGD